MFVQHDLSPSLLDGIRDSLGKRPNLFDHLDDCQVNELQYVHGGITRVFRSVKNRVQKMMMDDSSDLGMAFVSAGKTRELIAF